MDGILFKVSRSLLCTSAALSLFSCESKKEVSVSRPNVIFILADDLGYGDIAPYGQTVIQTPHLTRLSNEGMKFSQCYAGSTVSAPSRAALMTGVHTGHTHIRGNIRKKPEGQEPMLPDTYTMAHMFRESGYTTGCFGKWGLGYPGSEAEPLKMGFDEFYGYNCQTNAHNYYPQYLWKGSERDYLTENQGERGTGYSADIIHKHALKFIEDNANQHFFAYLSYTLPHAELKLPHDSIYDYYCNLIPKEDERAWIEKNPDGRGAYSSVERPMATFASMVTRLDSYVGDVMELLKDLGIEDNTMIIFTSDNGPHCEGGADPEYFSSSGPLKGIKRDLYEGGIRVPLIVKYPTHVENNSVNNQVVAFWDFMPTFAELVHSQKQLETDGISFLPTLMGEENQRSHEYLYWEFHDQGGKQAVLKDNWKCIKLNVGRPDRTSYELYNINEDLHEDHNLADQYPEKVEMFKKIMDEARVESELFKFSLNSFK